MFFLKVEILGHLGVRFPPENLFFILFGPSWSQWHSKIFRNRQKFMIFWNFQILKKNIVQILGFSLHLQYNPMGYVPMRPWFATHCWNLKLWGFSHSKHRTVCIFEIDLGKKCIFFRLRPPFRGRKNEKNTQKNFPARTPGWRFFCFFFKKNKTTCFF